VDRRRSRQRLYLGRGRLAPCGSRSKSLRVLAEADVFASLGLSRRQALWAAAALASEKPLPLFAGDLDGEGIVEALADLPAMTMGEEVVEDYVEMRLTLRAHPMAFLRHRLTPGAQPLEPVEGAVFHPGIDRAKGLMRTDLWGAEGSTDSRRESKVQ